MIKKIAHIGIATHSLAVMSEFYRTLGLEIDSTELVEDQKVRVALMRVGESSVELLEATEEDSVVARFIEKRGEGIHHVALEVDDLQAHLDRLKENHVKLIDENPRPGAEGRLIAFIHPDSTGGVLVELSQPVAESSE
jgi:methylmalonyl-CoA epimerase